MGLTRPTLTQFNTTSIELSDPLSLLNKGSTAANIDIGFVMNRNGGTQANVAIVWKESANSFVTAFTTGSGVSNANITIGEYANLRVNSLTGTISTAAQPNITSLGNLTSLATSGNISTTGYFLGNGSLLSGITASGVSLTSSNVAPMGPSIGALWYDTDEDILFQYINDGDNNIWIDITSDPVTTVAGNTNKALYTAKANVTTAITLIDTVTASGNASVSWTLTSKDNTNGRFKSSMINSLNDSANVYYNEFAEIYSDANYQVAVFTSNIVSGNVNLYAVGDSNDVTVSYQRTILGSSTTNTYLLSGSQGTAGPAGNITNPITTAVNITNTSTSTSNITGALTVAGGVGISGNIYQLSGQQLNIGTELTATLLPAGASPMQIVTNTDSNNRVVVQNINTGSNASAGIAFATSTGSATQGFLDVGIMSTGANFGSLRSGDSFIFAQATTAGPGGNLHIGATRNIRMFATNLASPWRDPVQVVEIFSSNLSFAVVSNTTSTSTSTGALTVTGGVGISSNLNVGGNISTTGYFLGNGSQLTGLPSLYGNTEVATYLPTYTGNLSAGATTIGGNLTVSGNLIVNGNVTYINANNVNINDSLIYLADDNPADTLDIGFVSAFTDATRYQHTGLVRDATDGVWKLFANVVAEPTTTIDFTNANYSNLQIGNLIANNITATTNDLTLSAISIGNVNLSTLGGLQFKAIEATGSVNVWNVRGGDGSTTSPRFTTEGTGTNIAGQFNTKGTGALQFYSGNTEQMRITNTASAVNYVQVTGATTGNQPSISAQGSDAGVILQLAAKGGSAISFVTNGVNSALQFQVLHTGSSVNYYQATGGAAGQPPRLISAGSDTNIDLTLTSKGSGNITTANSVVISNSSASTSTTTGALVVTGGVGVGGNLNVSGEINTSKTVTALNILNPFLLAGM